MPFHLRITAVEPFGMVHVSCVSGKRSQAVGQIQIRLPFESMLQVSLTIPG